MNCPKCNLVVEEDSLFCEHCGALLRDASAQNQTETAENIEQTMVIPVVKTDMAASFENDNTDFTKPSVSKTAEPNKKRTPKEKNLKTKIMLMVLSFVITLAIGFGICAVVVLTGSRTEVNKSATAQTKPKTEQTKKEEKEEPAEIVEGSSEGTEEKTGISVDTNFSFKLGKKLESSELSYKTLKSTEFAYACDIPSSFRFVSDADGEIRYRAEDNTAYMDVGAFANEHNLTLDEIKNMVQENLNGSVEREESGDGWFIMSTKASGVVYYFKCYADDFIRYVEFAYPQEYREIYDVYVSDIESTFERLE